MVKARIRHDSCVPLKALCLLSQAMRQGQPRHTTMAEAFDSYAEHFRCFVRMALFHVIAPANNYNAEFGTVSFQMNCNPPIYHSACARVLLSFLFLVLFNIVLKTWVQKRGRRELHACHSGLPHSSPFAHCKATPLVTKPNWITAQFTRLPLAVISTRAQRTAVQLVKSFASSITTRQRGLC